MKHLTNEVISANLYLCHYTSRPIRGRASFCKIIARFQIEHWLYLSMHSLYYAVFVSYFFFSFFLVFFFALNLNEKSHKNSTHWVVCQTARLHNDRRRRIALRVFMRTNRDHGKRQKQKTERNLISEYLHCHVYWIMLMKFDASV